MTNADNETENDSLTRTGGHIETRESALPTQHSSSNDNDSERTGGHIETRESVPPPPSGDDDGPERGDSGA
jgi:hypothetical protein